VFRISAENHAYSNIEHSILRDSRAKLRGTSLAFGTTPLIHVNRPRSSGDPTRSHEAIEASRLRLRGATEGTMPGLYTLIRPDTKLSADDVGTICVVARRAGAPIIGEEQP